MVDFSLTEQQREIKDFARQFRERFLEKLNLMDEYNVMDPRKRFPLEIIREASRLGLRTLAISPEYGGLGVDSVSLCLAVEELSYADLGIAVVFAQTWKISRSLERAANKEQKEKFLRAFVNDPEMVVSIGGTEPTGGSDIWIPYNHPDAGIRTKATLEKDEWVLNGGKIFISNAAESKLYLILARTDLSKPPYEGTSLFIVPRDTPGLSIGEIYDKIGERRANNAEIILSDARIPKENLLGKLNNAYSQVMPFFGESNALAGATPLGTARRAFDTAYEYAKLRVAGGKLLIDQQAIGIEFADMRMKLRAAWNLVLEAAWAFNNQQSYDPSLAWMAKAFAADVSFEVCKKALEMFGGYGIMRGSRVEKCLRDATVFLHSDLTALALRIKVWNAIRGQTYSQAST